MLDLRHIHGVARQVYPHRPGYRWRFCLRGVWYMRQTTPWLARLTQAPWLARVLAAQPQLAERVHRPYQQARFGADARLAALLAHYDACVHLGWTALCVRAATRPVVLAELRGRAGDPLRLQLGYEARFFKEGEWALSLMEGERRLYSAVVSLRGTPGRLGLFIGCFQGPSGPDAVEKVRALTHDMHGERPRSLMIEVVRALAACAGCTRIEMTSNADHIYRSARLRYRNWRRRKSCGVRFDYDAFALEHGSGVQCEGAWQLDLQGARRSVAEVPSRKRAQIQRKYRLIDDVCAQIHATIERHSDETRWGMPSAHEHDMRGGQPSVIVSTWLAPGHCAHAAARATRAAPVR